MPSGKLTASHQPYLLWLVVLVCTSFGSLVYSHPADITPLQIKVERQELQFRFTLNLFTLGRLIPLDENQDLMLAKSELKAAQPALAKFLQEHVLLRINDQKAKLGGIARFEPLWPKTDQVDLRELDRSVDVVFTLPWPEVIANFWLEFTCFPTMGEQASIQATYEQGELRMQVPFSQSQPDYQYDTGFAVEDLFQDPEPKPPASHYELWGVYLFEALIVLIFLPLILSFFRKPKKG